MDSDDTPILTQSKRTKSTSSSSTSSSSSAPPVAIEIPAEWGCARSQFTVGSFAVVQVEFADEVKGISLVQVTSFHLGLGIYLFC